MRFVKLSHSIKSADSVHTLNGVIYVPVGTVKATFQIVHGMCEHIELYDEFMTALAQNGYAAFIHDQLGHGKTAGGVSGLGFFAEENGGDLLVEDAKAYAGEFLPDYACVKHFLFGHSMGSFTARIMSELYPETADGLILAGTSGPQKAAPLGIVVTDVKSRLQGGDHRSESAQRLFYDVYNYEFKDENRDYSWLSTDPNVITAHEQDDLFNFTFSIKAMNDVVRLCTQCNRDEWFESYRSDLPALIISGENDPLGNFGKGALEVYKRIEAAAPGKATFKLYGGVRHELLHDVCRGTVTEDILTWLGAQL